MAGIAWRDPRNLLLWLALAATGCGERTPTEPEVQEEPEAPVVLEALLVGPEGAELRVTDALTLSVTASHSDGTEAAVDPTELAWTVPSGGDVVAVDETGTLTGLAVGTATVRAQHPDGASAELEVTVRAFRSEGDLDEPVVGELPYRGEVDDGMSVYRLQGMMPGQMYTIEVTAILGEIGVYGYSDGAYSWERCAVSFAAPGARCPVPASAEGELHLIVTGHTPSGSIYTLDAVPGGIPNEGSPTNPLDIAGSLPYAGTVSNSDSYYVIRGLAPGETYTVHLTDPTGDVYMMVASSGDWGRNAYRRCSSDQPDTSEETCAYAANAEGDLHVRVWGGNTPAGASYTLDMVPGGFFDEGVSIDPIDVTGAMPYAGQVASDRSHYLVTGLEPGKAYTITVSDLSDQLRLHVYSQNPSHPSRLECTAASSDAEPFATCAAKAVTGELYMQVVAAGSIEGATFTLDVAPGGIPREGNVVVPLDITGALPYSGSVNPDGSFYLVTGLVPGTTVDVMVRQPTAAIGLQVLDASTRSVIGASDNFGMQDESCLVTVGDSGGIEIWVDTRSDAVGAYYVVDVSEP